jgi:hypothetical protein
LLDRRARCRFLFRRDYPLVTNPLADPTHDRDRDSDHDLDLDLDRDR